MNLNTVFLGVIAAALSAIAIAVVIVTGVWFDDRFDPRTPEQIMIDEMLGKTR